MKSWTPKPEMYDVGRPFPASHIEALFKDLPVFLDKGQSALQVFEPGCGTGRVLMPIARAHPQWSFVGIDSAPGCLSVFRSRLHAEDLRNVTVHEASIPTGIPEGPFDLIVHSSVLHVIPGWLDVMEILKNRLSPGGAFCLLGDYGDLYDAALGRTCAPGIDPNLELFWRHYVDLRRNLNIPGTESSQIGCRWDLESTQLADWLTSSGLEEFHTTRVSWLEKFTFESLLSIVESRCYSSMFTVKEDLYAKLVVGLKRGMSPMNDCVATSRHSAVARFFKLKEGKGSRF